VRFGVQAREFEPTAPPEILSSDQDSLSQTSGVSFLENGIYGRITFKKQG
jgi:hypothetical protein